jgi:5-formyltetrahydrofolate cyclo-ligase
MAAPHFSSIDDAKAAARKQALAARAGCDPALGAQLAAHVLAQWPIAPGAAVAGFWPMPGEIDIRPLLTALHERGHRILLPVTPRLGQALTFRTWTPGATMIQERFGTFRPDGPEGVPDILFVPLVAFDRHGHRLGYGGGFYDRTLAGLPGRPAIGCCFAAQELDAVPTDEYDAPLTAIATERGLLRF